jgi:AraC-like DNA-binding protein
VPTLPLPPQPAYLAHHEVLVRDYAARHFTDPDVCLEEVAIFYDVTERTLRKSLRARRTSWREILRELRMERALELLKTTPYTIEAVSRLSGYKSRSAFAKVFREQLRSSPHEYRRGQGGPARAGGPTGAFYKPARRARGEDVERSLAVSASERAITDCEISEASARASDQSLLEHHDPHVSISAITDAWTRPRRFADDPEFWRSRRREFDAWAEEGSASAAAKAAAASSPGFWPARGRAT